MAAPIWKGAPFTKGANQAAAAMRALKPPLPPAAGNSCLLRLTAAASLKAGPGKPAQGFCPDSTRSKRNAAAMARNGTRIAPDKARKPARPISAPELSPCFRR